jgi:hypothetical protein
VSTVTGRPESRREATNFLMDDAGWPTTRIKSREGKTSVAISLVMHDVLHIVGQGTSYTAIVQPLRGNGRIFRRVTIDVLPDGGILATPMGM